MKKLKKVLLSIDKSHVSNYKQILSDEFDLILEEYISPVYHYKEIRFDFEFPARFEMAQPCLYLAIPLKQLGLDDVGSCSYESAVAIEDYVLRSFEPYVKEKNACYYNKNKAVAETGAIYIHHPGQEMVKRNSVYISDDAVIIALIVILPTYNDGRINGKKASTILTRDIPEVLDRFIINFDLGSCRQWQNVAEIQRKIRSFIAENELVCFIANNSILPRASGTEQPLLSAVPFVSTKEDEIEVVINESLSIKGMVIRKGITVITGGGYSGKSTLLDAIESGIYKHIPGDGREFVITDGTAIKIYAEDGRPISHLDISPFIRYLPMGERPSRFTTHHASGSTSQAANIIEAINAGSKTLLIDEDKSATNFMIRDSTMKLIVKDDPIIPFTDRAREIRDHLGVSTVLVIGGSSEYLHIADTVLLIDEYIPYNLNGQIKELLTGIESDETVEPAAWKDGRRLSFDGLSEIEQLKVSRLEVSGREYINISDEVIDITLLSAIVSEAQAYALAEMLRYVRTMGESMPLDKIVNRIFETVHSKGLDAVCSSSLSAKRWLEIPRPIELYALICRLRSGCIG